MSGAGALTADRTQLARFVHALFDGLDPAGYVSLRAFRQFPPKGERDSPLHIEAVRLNLGLEPVIDAAVRIASRVANGGEPAVFACPLVTLKDRTKARASDVHEASVLSVEIDQGDLARMTDRLSLILGERPTIAMHSGSLWINPETGELLPKGHLHWHLSQPARGPEQLHMLHRARDIATLLAGGDPSGTPPVHPLRWPGSWNRKTERPVMARIVEENAAVTIDLGAALAALEDAAQAADLATPRNVPHLAAEDLPAELADIAEWLKVYTTAHLPPSGKGLRQEWNKVAMAIWRVTNGSEAGFELFRSWSAACNSRFYTADGCRRRWDGITGCPATWIGARFLRRMASEHGWKPATNPSNDPGYVASLQEEAAAQQARGRRQETVGEYEPSLPDNIVAALFANPQLAERWNGGTQGLDDTSPAGRDADVLRLLRAISFTRDDARTALLHFQHGRLTSEADAHTQERYFKTLWRRIVSVPIEEGDGGSGTPPPPEAPGPEPPPEPEPPEPEPRPEPGPQRKGFSDPDYDVLAETEMLGPNLTLTKLIDIFNRKYAVVNDEGKAFVMWAVRDEDLNRERYSRATFKSFEELYQNRTLGIAIKQDDGNTKVIVHSYAHWWLRHERRHQYMGGVTFDPSGQAPPSKLNLWRGFAVEPRKGDWSLMRRHIRTIVCCGDREAYVYLTGWLARMVQLPWLLAEVASVLRGEKGAGKGLLGRWLCELLGQHAIHLITPEHLTGRFNAHLRDVIFIFADEAFHDGNKQHEGILNGLITEKTIMLEGKFQNPVRARNMIHLLMAANADYVVPASPRERRFFVRNASDEKVGEFDYFHAIDRQMEQGGLAAMLYDLLRVDLSDFKHRAVPGSDELNEQKLHSLTSLQRWWLAVLDRGFVWKSRFGHKAFLSWDDFVTTELLVRSYNQWCAENRVSRAETRVQLGRFMAKAYAPGRRRAGYPVYERESFEPGTRDSRTGKRGQPDDTDPVVRLEMQHGWEVGLLDGSREAFRQSLNLNERDFPWNEKNDDDDSNPE